MLHWMLLHISKNVSKEIHAPLKLEFESVFEMLLFSFFLSSITHESTTHVAMQYCLHLEIFVKDSKKKKGTTTRGKQFHVGCWLLVHLTM